MQQDDLEKIKILVEEFLQAMGVQGFSVEVKTAEETVDVAIVADEPQFLIGQNGQTLLDLQRLLRMVVGKKLGQPVHIRLDINQYQEKKVDQVKKMAREAADQVSLTGLAKTLPPMSSYERRIIHAELAGRSDVITQSQGEGPERCVVIASKPAK